MLPDFRGIARTKLLPACRIVIEPLAQHRAGREFLDPLVDVRIGAADVIRPLLVNQYPLAVVGCWRHIRAFQFDVASFDGHAHMRHPVMATSGHIRLEYDAQPAAALT